MRSSRTSAPCRLEWRPSPWLRAWLVILGVLASFAVLASEMPCVVAWPVAAAALMYGSVAALRLGRRAPVALVVAHGPGGSAVDGQPVQGMKVRWRGPLAFVAWRDADGRARHLSLWPDVLSPAVRRELRLAAPVARDVLPGASVAP